MRQQLAGGSRVHALAHSHNSSLLAIGTGHHIAIVDRADRQAQPLLLQGHTGEVVSLAWSPEGDWLASGSEDATVRLWPFGRSNGVIVLSRHASAVRAITFSTAGAGALATADDSGTILLWRLAGASSSDEPSFALLTGGKPIHTLAWSPAPEPGLPPVLAAGGMDKRLWLWAIDGDVVAAGGPAPNGVGLRDKSLIYHSDVITSLDWTPDGRYIATTGWDRRVFVLERTGANPYLNESWADDLSLRPFDTNMVYSDSNTSELITSLAWMPYSTAPEAAFSRMPQLAVGTMTGKVHLWAAAGAKGISPARKGGNSLPLLRPQRLHMDQV